MKPLFRGIVQNGKIKFDNVSSYLVYLSGLEGKRIEFTIQKERHARSLNQNSFYWAVVVEILGQHFGYEPEEMHEALKFKFLKKHEGSDLVTVGSTAKLSTVEFGEYLDKIIRWAATEYQVVIPSSDEFFF